jgi:hypothetical protein
MRASLQWGNGGRRGEGLLAGKAGETLAITAREKLGVLGRP